MYYTWNTTGRNGNAEFKRTDGGGVILIRDIIFTQDMQIYFLLSYDII
jgi:hypothetical protein